MDALAQVRAISGSVACLAVRLGRGGIPTAAGQDKSRSLRRGRTVGKWRHIKHFVRGATAHDSLPPATTHWRFDANRTSRASAP